MDRPTASSANLTLSALEQPENLSSDVSGSFSHADDFVEVDSTGRIPVSYSQPIDTVL